jgi:hypothetical protein
MRNPRATSAGPADTGAGRSLGGDDGHSISPTGPHAQCALWPDPDRLAAQLARAVRRGWLHAIIAEIVLVQHRARGTALR